MIKTTPPSCTRDVRAGLERCYGRTCMDFESVVWTMFRTRSSISTFIRGKGNLKLT
jgi:hypothetical protein